MRILSVHWKLSAFEVSIYRGSTVTGKTDTSLSTT